MPSARVLIDGPSELVFDYAIPADLPVQPGCRVRIPLRNRHATGTVLAITQQENDFALRPLTGLIDPEPLITQPLLDLANWIAQYYGSSLESVIRSLLPEAVRNEENSAKTRKSVVLLKPPSTADLSALTRRAPRQAAILSSLAAADANRIALADLGHGSSPAIKALEKLHWLAIEDEEVRREPDADSTEAIVPTHPLVLNAEQQLAYQAACKAIDAPEKPLLLLGVTGSGKTEVYLQAARYALDQGKSVLVIVPEISLTPQTVRHFKARFAECSEVPKPTAPRSASTFHEARQAASEFLGTPITNIHNQTIASLSGNNLRKILNEKASSKSISTKIHSFVTANLDTLFQRAIKTYTDPNPEEINLKARHRYHSPFVFQGETMLAKITLLEFKEIADGTKIYTVEVVEKIKPAIFKASSISENRRNYNRVAGFDGKLDSLIQDVNKEFPHPDTPSPNNQVAVLHSHLSQGERFDEWHRIRRGHARIVIGARSAIFAPLPQLGLIIVDEEHENSYKQDTTPRYHARDIAVLRANKEKCAILLGSATPSLESFHNAREGKYQLLRLNLRADGQSMPIVRVVDMRLEQQKQKNTNAIFSDKLRQALEQRLERGEQSILFLNRRGFARSLQCHACGHVIHCPHCSFALTYHRTEERLVCHVCGHQAIVPRKCPACNDPGIALQGYGTQKVEEILTKLLPKARFARIDADIMRKKNTLRDTLLSFKAKKIDILIGTQMIAKGLHFPNVTLVGILNADIGLHVPDFRASERTFQLLTQVAGRAGRGELEGEVFIQTSTPHAPAIQYARRHDFDGFSEQELEFRRAFHFPPYERCAVLTVRSTHERRAEFTLQTLHRRLTENLPPHMQISDPLPSPLIKSHGQFRFQITLRHPQARALTRHVQEVLKKTTLPEDVIATFDMDALSFT